MKRLLLLGLPLLLLLGAPAGEAGSIARFREVEASHAVLGTFAGATEVWRSNVLLATQQKVLGTGIISCVLIDDSESTRECHGTYRLPEGVIQLAGSLTSRARFSLLVVAGSGAYEGKHGVASFVQISPRPRQAFVSFFFP